MLHIKFSAIENTAVLFISDPVMYPHELRNCVGRFTYNCKILLLVKNLFFPLGLILIGHIILTSSAGIKKKNSLGFLTDSIAFYENMLIHIKLAD